MGFYDNRQLHSALKDLAVINSAQLDAGLVKAEKTKRPLGEVLLEQDLISPDNLGRTLAELTQFPYINLAEQAIDKEILKLIPEVYAKANQIIAYKKDRQGLHLGMVNPTDFQVAKFVAKKTGLPVKTYLIHQVDFFQALKWYNQEAGQVFEEIIGQKVSVANATVEAETPIIKILDTIINYAYQNQASDIHLEPQKKVSVVRFRIDGILHDIVSLPISLHPRLVTRIKILSNLRTDEHRAAQDGKLDIRLEAENLDVRISIVPVTEGEKVVMRLLSERSRQFSLADLGFSGQDLVKVEAAYKKPHGLILATGPTGSGKTTTLYAVLKLLNQRQVNIMTIEDPVEYDMEGVNQIQVNPKTGLTFAKGLRSIVRQDPDIILVGEVRDEETAGIAINSAMTGHLVLSTLHTNNAATAIPRLLDMGIEPFLIASTVNIIIAQRLVRKICSKCRISVEKPAADLTKNLPQALLTRVFDSAKITRVYQGKGCPVCHQTGYVGRIGIFEVMLIDDKLRPAIVGRQDAQKLQELGVTAGMTSMLEDGLKKVKAGLTTIEEIIRVTKEN